MNMAITHKTLNHIYVCTYVYPNKRHQLHCHWPHTFTYKWSMFHWFKSKFYLVWHTHPYPGTLKKNFQHPKLGLPYGCTKPGPARDPMMWHATMALAWIYHHLHHVRCVIVGGKTHGKPPEISLPSFGLPDSSLYWLGGNTSATRKAI